MRQNGWWQEKERGNLEPYEGKGPLKLVVCVYIKTVNRYLLLGRRETEPLVSEQEFKSTSVLSMVLPSG